MECNHVYSKTIDQSYPRTCISCNTSEQDNSFENTIWVHSATGKQYTVIKKFTFKNEFTESTGKWCESIYYTDGKLFFGRYLNRFLSKFTPLNKWINDHKNYDDVDE